jgi:hypothetical protein
MDKLSFQACHGDTLDNLFLEEQEKDQHWNTCDKLAITKMPNVVIILGIIIPT